MKIKINKYFVHCLGSFLLGIGIAFCNVSNIGTDPLSVFVGGIANIFKLDFGVVNMIISCCLVVIAYFLDKKNIALMTVVSPFVVSLGIDSLAFFVAHLSGKITVISILINLLGITIMAIGSAISLFADCGIAPYDALIYGIKKYWAKDYHIIRWIIDLSFIVGGALLGGVFGIGTIMTLIIIGKLVEVFLGLLRKSRFIPK